MLINGIVSNELILDTVLLITVLLVFELSSPAWKKRHILLLIGLMVVLGAVALFGAVIH
jgi:hypothetical protein